MLIDGIELMEGSEARNLTVARAQLREIFASAQTPALIDPEDQQVLVPSRPVDIDEYEFYYVPISMLPEGVEPMEATHRLVKPAEKPELLEGMPPMARGRHVVHGRLDDGKGSRHRLPSGKENPTDRFTDYQLNEGE